MDPDTKMRESMRVHRKSSLDFSCAPTYDSPRGFNSSTRIKNIKNVTHKYGPSPGFDFLVPMLHTHVLEI